MRRGQKKNKIKLSMRSLRIWSVIIIAITPILYNAIIAQNGKPEALKRAEYVRIQNTQKQKLIKNIQTELKNLLLYHGPIDGKIGQKTKYALKIYYKKYGLDQNLQLSQKILEHMMFNRQITQAAQNNQINIPKTQNKQREKIRIIQIGLSELGYQPGPIDGQLSPQTKNAIRNFQKHRKMKPNPVPSQKLIDEIKKITGISQITHVKNDTPE